MRVVGITGGFASGKSTVTAMFKELGAHVVDADRIAKEILLPNQPAYFALIEAFGTEILSKTSTKHPPDIDRARLAEIVFESAHDVQRLNAICHPEIVKRSKEEIEKLVASHAEVILYEAALLIETGRFVEFDEIIVVDIPIKLQIERGMKKGYTQYQMEARIGSQASRQERLMFATHCIDNSGSLEKSKDKVNQIWTTWMASRSVTR